MIDRKKKYQLLSGILSGIATIVGASSVFQAANTAHVIALIAGSFGLGATLAAFIFYRKKEASSRDES